MSALLWGGLLITAILAIYGLRRAGRLSVEVERLKREHYYMESRVKRVPEEIREAVEPLRVHLAAVAAGGTVSKDMILNGQLYREISAVEAQRLLEETGRAPDKVLLLDVRTPKEYAIKRLSGAKLVPFDELESRYKTEVPETPEKIFVYCAGGDRSRSACDFLSRRGYANLYNVRDGLQGWQGPMEGEGALTLIQIERGPSAGTSQPVAS